MKSASLLPLVMASVFAGACHVSAAVKSPKLAIASTNAAGEATKQFRLADGLELTLFAAEPMVRNPTDMDVDERGRVWITEGINYRSTFQKWGTLLPEGDRIVILEDTDGDGAADKQTVFYQDFSINAALGVCVLGDRVIISDSPNVFVLTDTDGDGRADKRELLFTGIAGVDHDHGVHAFVFGPDGKLYFNMGNESRQLRYPLNKDVPLHGPVTNVPSKPVIDKDGNEVTAAGKPYRMGMVFRCNPNGSDVETLAWNFRNNYEVAVDSFGTLWQSDNDDDGNRGVRINYVMEYGNFGYSEELTGARWSVGWEKARARGAPEDEKVFYEWHQRDPGVVPNLLHTGAGSPTGITVYEGKPLWNALRGSAEHQTVLVHCDAGPRIVRAYQTVPEGAGYGAQIKNLVETDDTWFRPADVCSAPDGSLLVADWNDAGVGGHNMVDQKVETITGRIYRIAPKGSKRVIPKSLLDTGADRVAALQSPNQATRFLAWTRLHQMQSAAESELVGLWKGKAGETLTSTPVIARARAVQLLARIKGKELHYVQEASIDTEPEIRTASLRIARSLGLDMVPLVGKLADDSSAQVRRECAISLRHNRATEAAKLWAGLANGYDGKDRWHLEALGIGADGQWDRFIEAWLAEVGNNWNTPASRDILWRSRSKKSVPFLLKFIQDKSSTMPERERYLRSLDFISGPEKNAALGTLLTESSQTDGLATEALSRLKGTDLSSNPAIKSAIFKVLERSRGTPSFVEIVRDFQIKGQEKALLEIAEREPDSSHGVEAMRLVLKNEGTGSLQKPLHGNNASAIVKALGNTEDKGIVPLLLPLLGQTNREVSLRKAAVQALARVQEGAAELVQLAKQDKLPSNLRLTAASALNGVRWENIKAEAAQVLPLPRSRDAQSLPTLPELLKIKGDPKEGAAVYQRETVGCFKCHQVNGQGTDYGPNLSEIGTKLGKDALYESILDPSAGISFGYEAWLLTLKNGNEAYGLIASETANEVAIRAVGGIVTRYPKGEIVSRVQQKSSIMPEGLQQTMSVQDLANLVEYLTSLRKR